MTTGSISSTTASGQSPPLSTIGAKYIVAVTGLLLIVFLFGHMAGNLLIFKSADSLNTYAAWLKSQTPLLWTARAGLLFLFVTHLGLTIWLVNRSALARPQKYVFERTQVASAASRFMIWSGIVILAFVIYHLAHYTFGVTHQLEGSHYYDLKDSQGRHDVYRMVVGGFRNIWIAGFYILCQIVLATHLYHGASSMLQTWGFYHHKYNAVIHKVGLFVALAIGAGNCSIPLAIQLGWVG
ncbi:MAG: succinate dehydrogenase cytochrome b subunit [Gemmatales bacterium]